MVLVMIVTLTVCAGIALASGLMARRYLRPVREFEAADIKASREISHAMTIGELPAGAEAADWAARLAQGELAARRQRRFHAVLVAFWFALLIETVVTDLHPTNVRLYLLVVVIATHTLALYTAHRRIRGVERLGRRLGDDISTRPDRATSSARSVQF
ncbi:hypothetical protein [Nocardia nepalensis]|uniref:hypothetical protein n=1 Tax=Nocardia nepalensis TaxID=3375448 RepID=UPI003B66FAE1